uniref:Probable beta-arrestin n=1 Tax=Cacopsylla melanoneura TaxID=428564 RepID=A0A8D8S2B9_9HEMI
MCFLSPYGISLLVSLSLSRFSSTVGHPISSRHREGCPIGPGFTLSKVCVLTPLLANNKDKWGLALDGQLKDEDTNLASSTLIKDPLARESLGIIVQYKVKVKLCLGALGGDLVAELPFTLMHPKPEDEEPALPSTPSGGEGNDLKSNDKLLEANLIQLDDTCPPPGGNNEDDIIFEDFARFRLKAGGETDA